MTLPDARRSLRTGAGLLVGLSLFCLASAPAAVQAQTVDEVSLRKTAAQAFFHVEVSGTPLDSSSPLQEARRFGKAFAIGESTLVTAMHVVGDDGEWKLARTTRDEITRAVRPLAREVHLTGANGAEVPPADVVVLPAPTHAIDAASILVPRLTLDEYFQLSLCDINEGEIYTALMTGADQPAGSDSVNSLEFVQLRAAGYDPPDYGALYVFNPEGTPAFASEPWGHGGSPIFDIEGNVVAVISAVTVTADGPKVLATPIQPLFPGTNQLLARAPDPSTAAHVRLKCSMADMVKRIHDQVASHAIWTVTAETEEGRPTGDIVFEYESVADPPNIAAIEVRYQFWGTESEGEELTRIAFRPSREDVVVLNPGRQARSF
ncbi:MAG: hypothetical protein OEO21_12330, partial [Candidatus Krumholzibacteria bacterium]|nr:hypothetical protein [Candidatus Krumholzibacteria bacterium]